MFEILIIVLVTLLIIGSLSFIICWPMIKAIKGMTNARKGERTKFEVDISDENYSYSKSIIEKWLYETGFSQKKKKANSKFLKYHINGNIFNFGFNYFRTENKLIIETWINILGSESPLTETLFYPQGNEKETPMVMDAQAKEEYIKLLKTLFKDVPEVIETTNKVTLVKDIQITDFKAVNKKEKISIQKMIIGIIVFSILIVLIPIFTKESLKPDISIEDQNEALNIIQTLYPTFELIDIHADVIEISNGSTSHYLPDYIRLRNYFNSNYYLMYNFYGTMDTPEQKNDEVCIHMSPLSGYSDLYLMDEDSEWSMTISQNKADGKRWNYLLEEK